MKKVYAAKNYIDIIEITLVQLISYLILVSISTLLIVNSFLSFEYRELLFILGFSNLTLSIAFIVNCSYRNKKDKKSEQERKIAFNNNPEQVARCEELEKQLLIKKVNEEKENLHIQAQIERKKQLDLFEKERLDQFAKLKIKQEEEDRIEVEAYQERVRQQEDARQIERDKRQEVERQLIAELREAYEKKRTLTRK